MDYCLFCPNSRIECNHNRRERFADLANSTGGHKFAGYLKCIFGYDPEPSFLHKDMYSPCVCEKNKHWQQAYLLNCSGFVDTCIKQYTGASIEEFLFNNYARYDQNQRVIGGGSLLNVNAVTSQVQNFRGGEFKRKCSINDLKEGDIIWTYPDNSPTYTHVMFYLGNHKVAGFNHPSVKYKNGIYDINCLYDPKQELGFDNLIAIGDSRKLFIDKLTLF